MSAILPASAAAWDLSCPDWEQRLRDGRPLVPDFPQMDVEAANRAERVMQKLRLADVPGTPTLEEAGAQWFSLIVRALFGSLDPLTRRRMIRELFVLVPKKNSKTTYGALMMLAALLLNTRPMAPFIMTAPVQDTAQKAFDAVAGAIELDVTLKRKLHVRDHLKEIVHRETKAKLEIVTFDPRILTGLKVAGALIDELHVVAKITNASSSIRQLRGGMLPFPEAFIAFITTQSEEQPTGIFRDELVKARAIRDGKRKGAMLPVLYEFPPSMQKKASEWQDSRNWLMVTPNAGKSIEIDRLVEEYQSAKDTSDAELRGWASQHLNVEIGVALAGESWSGAEFWEQTIAAESLTLEDVIRRSEVITIGIDGGGLDDLLGLAVLGREVGSRKWLLWVHAWAHPIVLKRRKDIAETLQTFANDGDLTLVDVPGEDVKAIAEIAMRIRDAGLLPAKAAIGVDASGVGDIVDALTAPEVGFSTDGEIVAISQGWKLNGAIKTTERKLAGGAIEHANSAFMNWVIGNAKPEPRGNAVMITKQTAGSAKIDPLMATFDAVSLMSLSPPSMVIGEDYEVLTV